LTTSESVSPYSEAASDLKALGFRAIPILPPTAKHGGAGKAPGEVSMGLWRGLSKWQRFRDQEPSAFETGLWSKYPGSNVGIVLGSPVGNLHVIAIDVDVEDYDDLQAILGAIPYSPMAKCGKKGTTQFYVADKSIKSKPYDRAAVDGGKPARLVDLLTGFDTRQTVCPPSIHPDGMTYVWTAGPVSARDLPEFTADDQAVLEETLATLGWSPDARRAPRAPARNVAPADADDLWSETKAAALANLSAWVPALDLYSCRPARGGYEAVATWRASSTGRPIAERKLNLSIQQEGVKDFGTNDTYSAIDLVMAARDCDQADATDWLRERLGLADDEPIILEQASTPERAAFTPDAQSQPWSELPYKTDRPPTTQTPLPSVSTVESGELPDHLTRVPGLVGAITDWIVASARRPQRGLSLASALTLVGTAAGRKFAGPTNSGTHLYILALGPSGSGKDHPLSMIGAILDAAGMGAHNGPSQFMSQTAVVKTLLRKPLCVCAMDEFGSFLRRINGRNAAGHEQAITGILRSAWGASFKSFNTPAYAQSDGERVIAPALSIVGASTAEEFYAAVDGGDLFNGFLNRFLTITTRTLTKSRKTILSEFDIPDDLTNGLVAIYNAGGALMGASMHGEKAGKPEIVVPWDCPQAERVFDLLGEAIEEREADAALLVRTAEMAVRLATIRAIGINHIHPVVTVADMEWGRDLAMWSAERMIVDAADYMSETPAQADANLVYRLIKERGSIDRSALLRKLQRKIKAEPLKGIVQLLADAGDIRIQKVEPPAGGPHKLVYHLARQF
jgi:hypothetical protein